MTKEAQMIKKIFMNTSWLLVDRVTRMILGILVGAAVARYLGPAEYGELAYILACVSLGQMAATLGLDGVLLREISSSKGFRNLVQTAKKMRMIAGAIIYLLGAIAIFFLEGYETKAIWLYFIIGASLLVLQVDVYDVYLQSKLASYKSVIVKLSACFISAALKIYLISVNADLLYFALAQLVEIVVGCFGLWLLIALEGEINKGVWDSGMAKKLLLEGWPFLISSVSIIAYMRIDQVMLKSMGSAESLGIYAAAIVISQACNFLAMIISNSTFPLMSKIVTERGIGVEEYMLNLFSLMLWAGVGCTFVVWLIAPYAIKILYGQDFMGSVSILRVHVVTNIFIFLGVAQSQWILWMKRSKLALMRAIIGVVVNVGVNLMLIPKYGAMGAAAAAVSAQIFSTTLSNIFLARNIFKLQMKSVFNLPSLSVWR